MTTLARRLATQFPDTNRDSGLRAQHFNEMATPDRLRLVFLALLGAVGFVLLIACANVANLLLARALGRTREISIRAALGAGRWRVVRQLLVESLMLSSAGGVFGWLIAQWGIRTFDAAAIPTGKPEWIDFSMDYRAFWYLAAISVGTGLLFGLVPALRLANSTSTRASRTAAAAPAPACAAAALPEPSWSPRWHSPSSCSPAPDSWSAVSCTPTRVPSASLPPTSSPCAWRCPPPSIPSRPIR